MLLDSRRKFLYRILWFAGLVLNIIGIYAAGATSGETLIKGGTLIGSTVIPTGGFIWFSAALLVLIGIGCWIAAWFVLVFQELPAPRSALGIIFRIVAALVVFGIGLAKYPV